MAGIVSIRRFAEIDKDLLSRLIQLYIYDLEGAGVLGVHMNSSNGLYNYPSFDSLFEPNDRTPMGIFVDDAPVGFALIYESLVASADWEITEFFVKRAYRRKGVGSKALRLLADELGGSYVLHAVVENNAATEFWRSAIGGNETLTDRASTLIASSDCICWEFKSPQKQTCL